MVSRFGLFHGVVVTLWRCFLEARPAVQGIFLLRFLAGASFAGPLLAGDSGVRLWASAAVWVCAMFAVYLINGAMDVEEDRINRSSRPVARGDLSPVKAAFVAGGLGAIALLGGLALGKALVLSVTAILALGWLYSGPPLYLKRWPAGLAVVAVLGGLLTYCAGYLSHGTGGDLPNLVAFAAAMSLWMGLVGQTKDLSDVAGDKGAGRKSGPVAWGEDAARRAYSAAAVAVGAAFAAWAVFASDLLAPAIVLVTGAIVVAATLLSPLSRGDRLRRRRPYRAFMLTQYGVHLAVLFW